MLGLLVVSGSAAAQFWSTEVRVTETLSHGQVDWTDGRVLSRDSATSAVRRGAGVAAVQAATQAARQGLLRVFDQRPGKSSKRWSYTLPWLRPGTSLAVQSKLPSSCRLQDSLPPSSSPLSPRLLLTVNPGPKRCILVW